MGVLTPHEILDPHAADYKWLAQVYEAIKPTKVSDALLWHRLGAKTLALVHGHIGTVDVIGTGLEEVVVDPEAIEAMRALIGQGELDLDPARDLLSNPVTLDEVLDTIDARIKRRLARPTRTRFTGRSRSRSSGYGSKPSARPKTASSSSSKH